MIAQAVPQSYTLPLLTLLAFSVAITYTSAFTTLQHAPTTAFKSTLLFSTSTEEETSSSLFSLELEKPLGIVLEEVTENEPNGVYVQSINEGGSAYEYAEKIQGLKLIKVMDDDVSSITFDEVMDRIINAPSVVSIDFKLNEEDDEGDEGESENGYEIGTDVVIKVLEDGKPESLIEAKVGDNLRKKLLENNIELYKGLKKKLGNCGGSGQCTFCAVDFVESDGWEVRSEYEDSRIGKYPNARLACMNNIQGPATIRIQ